MPRRFSYRYKITRYKITRYIRSLWAALFAFLVLLGTGCSPAQRPLAEGLENTPRLAIVSAFEPELKQTLSQTQEKKKYEVNGRTFTTGQLEGRPVLLFYSGVSMVNAAMNTQAAIDHFNITAILFTGIAGGVNPNLRIGDVVVPKEWAQYQEQVFARQAGDGDSWDTGWHPADLGNYGMMFPQTVAVTRGGERLDAEEGKFWFSVDPQMLAVAQKTAGEVALKRCPKLGPCLQETPRVVVGGRGASGPTFVDNAAYRGWVWETFQVDAVDMETAAVAHVAYTNNTPFLAFRSLSDLAGGGPGQNEIVTFMQLAADNSSATLLAFLRAWQP
jgi:adenosylhomocysteine nucleosidase